MIKAKPRKKNEIKINEKQEIKITRQPNQEQLDQSKLAYTLLNIGLICQNHKDIWDNEIKNNDGFIRFDKLMMISKAKSIVNRIFNANFQADEEEENVKDNFFFNNVQVHLSVDRMTQPSVFSVSVVRAGIPGGKLVVTPWRTGRERAFGAWHFPIHRRFFRP